MTDTSLMCSQQPPLQQRRRKMSQLSFPLSDNDMFVVQPLAGNPRKHSTLLSFYPICALRSAQIARGHGKAHNVSGPEGELFERGEFLFGDIAGGAFIGGIALDCIAAHFAYLNSAEFYIFPLFHRGMGLFKKLLMLFLGS